MPFSNPAGADPRTRNLFNFFKRNWTTKVMTTVGAQQVETLNGLIQFNGVQRWYIRKFHLHSSAIILQRKFWRRYHKFRLQHAFPDSLGLLSNFMIVNHWIELVWYRIIFHFWFNGFRAYKKLFVFAKQGAYKMLRVTSLQKGGPTTNFSYKKSSPDHFIPYTCSFL